MAENKKASIDWMLEVKKLRGQVDTPHGNIKMHNTAATDMSNSFKDVQIGLNKL